MKEYFPEKLSHQKVVPPNESIEIEFESKHDGPIILNSHTLNDDEYHISPLNVALELFDGSKKIVATGNETQKSAARLVYQPLTTDQNKKFRWKAKLTNLGHKSIHLYFEVSFPGNFPVRSVAIPEQVVVQEFQNSLCETKIRITSGENASFIVFTEDLEVNDIFFTVPDFEHTLEKIWPIPDLHIFEYTNSINSANIQFSLMPVTSQYPNGFFRLSVRFEEIGSEILGTYHCQLNDMLLTIDLGAKLLNQTISYDKNNIRINFSYDLNILGLDPKLKDYVLAPILEYTDTIKKTMEKRLRSVFLSNDMLLAFAKLMNNSIERQVNAIPSILSGKIEENYIVIQYFSEE